MSTCKKQQAFTLVELMIALALSGIVLAAVAHAFLGSKVSFMLNRGLSTLQDNGRHGIATLERYVRMTGFQNRSAALGPLDDAISGTASPGNDTLTLRFGTGAVPALTDCAGTTAPANDVVELSFTRDANNDLICKAQSLVSLKNASVPLVSGVEYFAVRYGEDTNNDRIVDVFVPADKVTNMQNVTTVQLCLIVNSQDRTDAMSHTLVDCDGNKTTTDDGLLRRRFLTTVNLRNRS